MSKLKLEPKSGFTLIELLITVAIVALGLAVFVSVLSGIKNRAEAKPEAEAPAKVIPASMDLGPHGLKIIEMNGHKFAVAYSTAGVGVCEVTDASLVRTNRVTIAVRPFLLEGYAITNEGHLVIVTNAEAQ